MLKYNCIAAVSERDPIKLDNEINTKYALIASPGRLYSADYLLYSYAPRPSYNIKNNGLSSKAINLYENMFGIKQSDLYLVTSKPNSYSAIWEKSFILSPYLMRNSHLFIKLFGHRSSLIENLRYDY